MKRQLPPTYQTHRVDVQGSPPYARCTCRWRGEARKTRAAAWTDATTHREASYLARRRNAK